MRVISFGGGVNSTAMLLALHEHSERVDLVLFADTGNEKPGTYEHVDLMRTWCRNRGIEWQTVTNAGRGQGNTLEELCLTRKELPSLAYGFKGCSTKWKRQPMDRYLKQRDDCKQEWREGRLVERCIGIDAGETRRGSLPPDKWFVYRYPLRELGIDREGCEAMILKHGLPVPPKSSCFFCPASTKPEVLALAKDHPDLMVRALKLESTALSGTVRSVKGLGRRWSWRSLLLGKAVGPEVIGGLPCGCHDGGGDDD